MKSRVSLSELETLAETIADAAVDLGLVHHEPVAFSSTFTVRLDSDRAFSSGGLEGGNTPFICLGLKGREFSDRDWLDDAVTNCHARYRRIPYQDLLLHAAGNERMYLEHDWLHTDPVIGSFVSNDPLQHATACLSHNVAHAVAEWNKQVPRAVYRSENHCPMWRESYARLRRRFDLVCDSGFRLASDLRLGEAS